ncbi:hypothetical protein ANME2D_01860 [Candidatus Methanoperedens nitroreducens]|uniref:Uncharacterized protein n=1 Tax=Candidatus Methanoperedens nitratireducens TaxID=1392998 RepID=A0A062V8W3_9EURY|nr:hypothetical protein [Candidatus Methanoperedens nitroreducens]KCZ71805.1 hypothetical protein ANME2D_01860 [Candidatus Methanoperedens nitroreducens]MDJ1422220.1 hypothetical protein [Candidatus Methanoperedens sp.]
MEQSIKRALLMLCILSIFIVAIPIAVAEGNQTNATGTPTANATSTPNVTTPTASPTALPTDVKEAKFRVGPTVKLRPVNDVINKTSDGLIELYMDNPSLNDVVLNVDARISVPAGIHVYGQGFGEAGAAGTVYGTFDVPPGKARTIYITIKAEKTGDFSAHFSGLYWPGDNKDAYNPISLTHPFKVYEPSSNPNDPVPSNPQQFSVTGQEIPYTWIILAAVILGGIGLIFALGRRPPKTEVNIEQ